MAKKKIDRARVNRSKDNAFDKFLKVGLAMCNRHQLKYRGDDSLWYAILSWNKYGKQSFVDYMQECVKYDQVKNNFKRVKQWQELLKHNLTVEEIENWGKKEYKAVWEEIEQELNKLIK